MAQYHIYIFLLGFTLYLSNLLADRKAQEHRDKISHMSLNT